MNEQRSLLARIYRLKLLALGALMVLAGLISSLLADWVRNGSANHLLVALLQALSDVLVVTGGFGIAIDFFTGRDREAADTERTRSVMKELVPEFGDAVIAGFVETPDNMRGIATTETLDKLATNALALRLGDEKFAAEITAACWPKPSARMSVGRMWMSASGSLLQ